MLIANSTRLCGVPHFVVNKLKSVSSSFLADGERGRCLTRDKKRHRRSSSFNSMSMSIYIIHAMCRLCDCLKSIAGVFEGLKKIVGAKTELTATCSAAEPLCPDSDSTAEGGLLLSPIIRPTVKRKVDPDLIPGFSIKKKYQ